MTNTTSNFEYPPNTGFDDYNDPEFPVNDTTIFPTPEDEAAASELCSVLALDILEDIYFAGACKSVPQVGYYYDACMRDIAVTGNAAFVENTIAAFARECTIVSTPGMLYCIFIKWVPQC